MSRPFSLQTVLRMIPNPLLKEFFEATGHGEFDPAWDRLKGREIEPMLAYLDELSVDRLNDIESVLRSVSDLASDSGFDALLEAGRCYDEPAIGSLAPEHLCVWGRAMWAWLRYRPVFDKAQIIHQIDQMTWWRKRKDLPNAAPDKSPEALASLKTEISTLLKSQGRGKDCTVETLARGDVDYFFAYPDDVVQNVVVHDEEGQLRPEAFRQTLLIVFAYDRREGSLETCAKLAKPVKEQLEAIFARTILHWELDAYDPDAAYELDPLMEASFDLTPDPQDRVRIRIRKMRLSSRRSGRRVLIEVDDDDPDDDIHKAIRECLNLDSAPLSEWHATLVTFCFEFLERDGRKVGRQSFDVAFPRSCSLRNARPERVEIIQKYLKRWNIDRASNPVAMGS